MSIEEAFATAVESMELSDPIYDGDEIKNVVQELIGDIDADPHEVAVIAFAAGRIHEHQNSPEPTVAVPMNVRTIAQFLEYLTN